MEMAKIWMVFLSLLALISTSTSVYECQINSQGQAIKITLDMIMNGVCECYDCADETGVGLKDDDDDDFYFLEVTSHKDKITLDLDTELSSHKDKITLDLDTELSSITYKTDVGKIKKITKLSTLFTTIRQSRGPSVHQKESSIDQTLPTIFKFAYPSQEPKQETVPELANGVDSDDLPEWVYYTIASAILGILGCLCGLTTWYVKKKLRNNLRNARRQRRRREQRENRDRGSRDYEELPLSNMSQLTGASVSIVSDNVENK